MNLELTAAKYRKFLIAFRSADITNAATGGETAVTCQGSTYYFQAPNFKLIAYSTGGPRINLTTYNHILSSSPKSLTSLQQDFKDGGGGGSKMNNSLSAVVAATSEAARSKVVEAAFQKVIAGASIVLTDYDVLFTAYMQPAKFNGLIGQDGSYKSSWRALKGTDYIHFFNAQEYTGDGIARSKDVQNLMMKLV